ncbi:MULTISPECIES: GFA family protein [unclassified Paracoccus (in: a-proteobacteria)]|uniref:GFA family protein n=1 Tax=unclassified Paracoccus (in: a-proteobacteria) TaxID=2688777 RepID=UPI001603D22F|nr:MULTISPECIES: GFA family protein [unclassified Paracoccus (in: a-proteobacteria)]MBB1492111.1 GFA family protein [Paracoccus sp. MC1854]MBB1497997.1 GFA family protein [Paracoccus sp. MC1862]QQO44379.1 GFA family protein [Paracoccus sp. MC1862]
MSSEGSEISGACLCGGVSFTGRLTAEPATACHCSQCRRWSGHVWVSAELRDAAITGEPLRWFRSSDKAERGFCATCGSSLFWRRLGEDRVAVSGGVIDPPTGLRLEGHIYVADKGDYYDITDGLPQQAQS